MNTNTNIKTLDAYNYVIVLYAKEMATLSSTKKYKNRGYVFIPISNLKTTTFLESQIFNIKTTSPLKFNQSIVIKKCKIFRFRNLPSVLNKDAFLNKRPWMNFPMNFFTLKNYSPGDTLTINLDINMVTFL